jgi:hypothetical protein
MRINGIGVVSKKEAMSILTKEGREEVKNGGITVEELGEMYKLEQVKKACKIGKCRDTFAANYSRIPDSLKEKLTPQELAELMPDQKRKNLKSVFPSE